MFSLIEYAGGYVYSVLYQKNTGVRPLITHYLGKGGKTIMKKVTIENVKNSMKGVFGCIKGLLTGDIETRDAVFNFNTSTKVLYILGIIALLVWAFVIAFVLHLFDVFTMSDTVMLIGSIVLFVYMIYCFIVFKYCDVTEKITE